jgi:WD40 repeat protein
MSAIFISHSSKDRDRAVTLHRKLLERGYESVFLDVDRDDGVVAGEKWEEVLYHKLRACQVMVALVTDAWWRSHWCFAELSHAREKGKTIIGLMAQLNIDTGVLRDTQVIPYVDESSDTDERLYVALNEVLDGRGYFRADESRPPYPGLNCFEEQDAAVFCGRDGEVRALLERLTAMRRDRDPGRRTLLVIGPSGSGKSSLVRSGTVPSLKRGYEKKQWVVLPPIRPSTGATTALAKAYVQCFQEFGEDRDWISINNVFVRALEEPTFSGPLELTDQLRMLAGRPDATLLITVDQVEEMLEQGSLNPSMSRLLRTIVQTHGAGLVMLGTLRSDFMGELQRQWTVESILYEAFPISREQINIPSIIAEPARIFDVRIEDKLVHALMTKVQTGASLPLLAFTLRDLWDRCRERNDRAMSLAVYDELGGLDGALNRKAEEIYGSGVRTPQQEQALRTAFLALVQVHDDDRYLRISLPKDRIGDEIGKVVDRFVNAGILVSDLRNDIPVIEVAHEAVFRGWRRLSSWLDEDREFLLWRRRLQDKVADWEKASEDPSSLLHGPLLIEAQKWEATPAGDLTLKERSYIDRSVQFQKEKQAKRVRLRRLVIGGVIAASVALAVTAILAGLKWREATHQEQLAKQHSQMNLQMLIAFGLRAAADGTPAQANMALQKTQESATGAEDDPRGFGWYLLWRGNHNEIGTMKGHEKGVRTIAFAPTGKMVATGSYDMTIKLWDVDNRREVTTLKGHTDTVYGVRFSPDGHILASCSADKSIKLWDIASRKELTSFREQEKAVYALAFTGNGKALVSGDGAGSVRRWDLAGNTVWHKRPHTKAVRSVATSPDGTIVASGSWDGTVKILDIASGEEKAAYLKYGKKIYSVAFSPNGQWLAIAGELGAVYLWEWKKADSQVHVLDQHAAWVSAVAFDPSGTRIVSGSGDGSLQIWDSGTYEKLATLKGHEDWVSSVAFSPDGMTMASAGWDMQIKLWRSDLRSSSLRSTVSDQNVLALAFEPGGATLATGGPNGEIALRDSSSGEVITRLQGHKSNIIAITFAPNGSVLASGSSDGTVQLWSLLKQAVTSSIDTHGGEVRSLSFSPDGRRLATAGQDGMIKLWNTETSELIEPLRGHTAQVNAVRYFSDGAMLASAGDDGMVRLWDAKGYKAMRDFKEHNGSVTTLALSHDGNSMATGGYDGTIRIWDTRSGSMRHLLRGHLDSVQSVAFAPDNKTLASGSWDDSLKLWDLATGINVGTIPGQEDDVMCVAFSPDGRRLVSATKSGTITFFVAASREEVAAQLARPQ